MKLVPSPRAGRLLTGIAAGLLVALHAAAAPAVAQACSTGEAAVLFSIGHVSWPLAGGGHSRGMESGAGGAYALGSTAVSGSLFYTMPNAGRARPLGARLRLERPLLELAGVTLCGGLLGGGSAARDGEDGAWTAAGGAVVGLTRRLSTARLSISPWVGARGLGARTNGDILGESFVTSGLSLGVEAGVGVSSGRAVGALRVTADRFDAALGATPYPSLAVRLVAGWRL
ncbi:MAG: hypothetical protein KY466_11355 [Gemmatimonadetes bacterium]|nr:hypothetical protein [Gemmatimonadota bacterium]